MSEIQLKSCPFCGEAAEIKRNKTVMASCTGCSGTTFQQLDDKDSAIRQWNARTLQPQWQDISTAPRDGTEILGFSTGVGVPLLIRWIAPQDYMTEGECESYLRGAVEPELSSLNNWLEEPSWCYADFLQGDILDSACQPTKWMPLPAAPEGEA